MYCSQDSHFGAFALLVIRPPKSIIGIINRGAIDVAAVSLANKDDKK